MRVGVVLVHYHTPHLLERAVACLLQNSNQALNIVAVDNGSGVEEKEVLAKLPIQVVESGSNLGYAGGLNLGTRVLGEMDAYLFMNPDVEVLPGCVDRLLARLQEGVHVVGPRLYLDREKRFVLPLNESRASRWDEVLRRVVSAMPVLTGYARSIWRKKLAFSWTSSQAVATTDLSGALFAVSGQALRTVGPLDETFKLYFEEMDWLYRAARLGLRIEYEPKAEGIHFYNQACQKQGRAAEWFRESEQIFGERYYGPRFYRFLNRVFPVRPVPWPRAETLEWPPSVPRFEASYELSPRAQGFPAAVCMEPPLGTHWSFSQDFCEKLTPGDWALRVVWPWGSEGPLYRFHKPMGEQP